MRTLLTMISRILLVVFAFFGSLSYEAAAGVKVYQEKNPEPIWIRGMVTAAEDGTPLAGASVAIVGTTQGTHTNGTGEFRLRVRQLPITLRIRSIGYDGATVVVAAEQPLVRIALIHKPYSASSVDVTADISAEEVVRRAVAKRTENMRRVGNYRCTVQSRKIIDDEIRLFGRQSKRAEYAQSVVQYTVIQDTGTKQVHATVVERKGSKSLSDTTELSLLPGFDHVLEDSIVIDDFLGQRIEIVRPLSATTFEHFRFKLLERRVYGDRYVYVIAFEPLSRLRPALEGVMNIIEGTYDVVSMAYRTTKETAIPILDSVVMEQVHAEVGRDIWLPVRFNAKGYGAAQGLLGAIGITTVVGFQSTISDYAFNMKDAGPAPSTATGITVDQQKGRYNVPRLPEGSIAQLADGSTVAVLPGADEQDSTFWTTEFDVSTPDEERLAMALADTSEPRRVDLRVPDTLLAVSPYDFTLLAWAFGPVLFHTSPLVSTTPTTRLLLGGRATARYDNLLLEADAALTAARSPLLTMGLSWEPWKDSTTAFIRIGGYATRSIRMIQSAGSGTRSTFSPTLLLQGTARDHYAVEGFGGSVVAQYGHINASMSWERSQHTTMPLRMDVDRPVPGSVDGRYQTAHLRFTYDRTGFVDLLGGIQRQPLRAAMEIGHTQAEGQPTGHQWLRADVSTTIPTIGTGYESMMLRVSTKIGLATDGTPGQFLSYSTPRFVVFGDGADLLTIPLNTYGGNRHYQAVVEHNCTDYLWRAAGLPTYLRRGVDLVLCYGAALFQARNVMLANGIGPTRGWYQEAGFAFDRIPTFLFDNVNARLDVRTSLPGDGHRGGKVGWSIGVTSVLF